MSPDRTPFEEPRVGRTQRRGGKLHYIVHWQRTMRRELTACGHLIVQFDAVPDAQVRYLNDGDICRACLPVVRQYFPKPAPGDADFPEAEGGDEDGEAPEWGITSWRFDEPGLDY